MSKVVFSSWGGNIVDNRKLTPDKYIEAAELNIPLDFDGSKTGAFMSWNGVVLNDNKIDVVSMTQAYLKEAQKLSCGECSVGYLGLQVMLGIFGKIAAGKADKSDLKELGRLAAGIREDARCDFCASAVTPILDTLKYFDDEYKVALARKSSRTRPVYVTRITAPCTEACPAHQDAPGYIELVKNRRYVDAFEVISKNNCMPGTTGRACVAFCEANCTRNDIDKPIAIRAIKRFVAENGSSSTTAVDSSKAKVAIVGAGPAGLAASIGLAKLGYPVTVFDEQSKGGGMALVGIPAYRLPKDVLEGEFEQASRLGVKFEFKKRLGHDFDLAKLTREGYQAVFVGTGAHLGRGYEIANWQEGKPGMVDGVKLLTDIYHGRKIGAAGKAIVVGGGNVALDCARTCLRLGFKEVNIVYRRSRAEMPGTKAEIEAAENEGVKITFLAAPVKVVFEGEKLIGVECVKMELGEPDASGRRRPVPVKDSEFLLPSDLIVSATGEVPDLAPLAASGVKGTMSGTVQVDGFYQTTVSGVFAGGDCITGPATVIEAIAAGNAIAKNIDRYLTTGKVTLSNEDTAEKLLHGAGMSRRRQAGVAAKRMRQSPDELPVSERITNFKEVEQCFTAEAAIREADRCLRCYRVMLLAVTK